MFRERQFPGSIEGYPGGVSPVAVLTLPRPTASISAVFYNERGHHTSSHTRPPKLWQTNIIGRSFYARQCGLITTQVAGIPTVSSLSRYAASDVSKFHAWFAILLCDTTPRQSATYASYPNVRTRAVGSSGGRRVLGHGSDASQAVQVFSRSPVRPWTKTMLRKNHQLAVLQEL